MNNASVRTPHRQYAYHCDKWSRIRHAIAGDLVRYLRDVGANESDRKYGEARQREYEDGAICYNFTKRTLSGMVGAVMRKNPEQIIPDSMEYLLKNADGSGVGLWQHAQDTLMEIDSIGRGGLLVDAPDVHAATMAEQNAGKLNPVIAFYTAENIINWKLERKGSSNALVMVVLREEYEYVEPDNEFVVKYGQQYRVLDIVDGKYRQRLFKFTEGGGEVEQVVDIYPQLGNVPVDEIPFTFIGASNNDSTIDDAPMLPLAELNIGHFRNCADNEEFLFTLAQAMLIIAPGDSMTPEQWKEANPGGVKYGSRSGLNVGAGGDAKLLQAAANNAHDTAINKKEQQAIQIGAQLITPTQQITAESARLQRGADTSVMATISNNVSEAYTRALKWVAGMMRIPEGTEIEFKLNTEFFLQQMTAQDRTAWMADINAGYLPVTAYYAALRASGVTDWKDEDITDALDNQMPTRTSRTGNATEVTGDIPATANGVDQQQGNQQQQANA